MPAAAFSFTFKLHPRCGSASKTAYGSRDRRFLRSKELEREFEVARVTVRQAVELLQNEGLVHRQQGRGTFVADKLQDKHWLRLETTWESLTAPIKDNVLKLIKVDNPPAFPTLTKGEGKLAPE
jgi:GntR family transcriptional regulator